MSIRLSRMATGTLVIAFMVLMSDYSWAIREKLGPSKDEWGLKYDVAVSDAGDGKVTVQFTLVDEGRLKPIYSLDVVAWSKPANPQAGRTYDLNVPIKLKKTEDGKRVGQVQIGKEFLDRAEIRIITLTVDGKRLTANGGAFYDIPISKYVNKTSAATSPAAASPSLATPPASKVTR